MSVGSGTQSLGRALDILFALAEAETPLTVTDIAEEIAVPTSTTYRLIQTLEQNGIIERKTKGQISLGMRILDLARSLHQQIDRELFAIARPVMENLTEDINETSILMVRTGLKGICVQYVECNRLIRFVMENGRTLPLHLGASGKAILAFENASIINKMSSEIIDKDKRTDLLSELERTRKEGYIVTVGEVDEDVLGIGTPVFDAFGRVLASLSIVGPENRFDTANRKESIQATINAASEITKKLKEISKFI